MTGFPIFTSEDRYKDHGLTQIRGVAPDAQTYIEGLQPYLTAKPRDTVLWSLHDAWNQDKHRMIQLMAALSTKPSITLVPPAAGRIEIFSGLKEDGAKLARVTFKEPSPHVQVHFGSSLQIVDKNDWKPDDPATVTYEETLSEISDVIGRLLMFL